MGFMYEFPHTHNFDSDLREILELFSSLEDIPNQFDNLKKYVDEYIEYIKDIKEVIESGELAARISEYLGVPLKPEFFGAVGDGITNDYNSINKMFMQANEIGLPVSFNGSKKYYIDGDPIIVNTNVDFCGATFIMPSKTTAIFSTIEGITKEIRETALSKYGTSDPDLFNKGFYLVTPIYLGERSGDNSGGSFYHAQYMMTDRDGYFLNETLDFDIIDGVYSAQNIQKLDSKTIVIGNANLDYSNVDSEYGEFFHCTTPNVLIHDISITGNANKNKAQAVIQIGRCCNIVIERVYGKNPSYDDTSASYVLGISKCSNITLNNCTLINNWGVIGSNYITNITYNNCILNRIDCHYGCYGLISLNDCIINNSKTDGTPISMGYGKAKIVFTNCVIRGRNNKHIKWRTDLPLPFMGEFIFKSCNFEYYGEEAGPYLLYWEYTKELDNNLITMLHLDELRFTFDKYCSYKGYVNIFYHDNGVNESLDSKTFIHISGLIIGAMVAGNANRVIGDFTISDLRMTDKSGETQIPLKVNKVINSDIVNLRANNNAISNVRIINCDIYGTVSEVNYRSGLITQCHFINLAEEELSINGIQSVNNLYK